jgi:hypothetical protein
LLEEEWMEVHKTKEENSLESSGLLTMQRQVSRLLIWEFLEVISVELSTKMATQL